MKYLNLSREVIARQLDEIDERLRLPRIHPLERRLLQEDRREFLRDLEREEFRA